MMLRAPYLFLIALAALFLVLIGQSAFSPVLYTLENDAYSPFHQNPDILKRVSHEQSETARSLMSDILDDTGTIVLNIRSKDFDAAERDLQEYIEKVRRLDRLVINLDMSESELEEFRRNSHRNRESLESLLNDTRRFDELRSLEIRYRDEDRPDLVYSVRYEGEALQSRIAENYRGYSERQDSVVDSGRAFELDTAAYEGSVRTFEEIVREIEAEQEARKRAAGPDPAPYRLTMAIAPDSGVYGDRLLISGRLSGGPAGGQTVEVFIDGGEWTAVQIDERGVYAASFRIGRIRAGTHIVHAASSGTYSDIGTFSILPLDTDLALRAEEGETGIRISGRLAADGIPVASAPISVTADGRTLFSARTNSTGEFSREEELEPGAYRIRADFYDDAFPLNPSESETLYIEVPPAASGRSALVYALFLIAAATGGIWYAWGRRRMPPPDAAPARRELEVPPEPVPDDAISGSGAAAPAPGEEPFARFLRLAEAGDAGEAAYSLYRHLILMLAERYRHDRPLVLTPREAAAAFADTPAAGPLERFVERYEGVRYGGAALADAGRRALAAEYRSVIRAIGGDSD